MPPPFTFDKDNLKLDVNTPLITRVQLLEICKEIDEDTPEEETTSFITTAHVFLVAVLDGYGIPDTLMERIALYLSAHFAVLSYPSVSREQLGPMAQSFFGKLGLGLENTKYGQSALSLDPTGVLKDMSGGKVRQRVGLWNLGNGFEDRRKR